VEWYNVKEAIEAFMYRRNVVSYSIDESTGIVTIKSCKEEEE